jgi:AmmeMemoRadiSam system protein A
MEFTVAEKKYLLKLSRSSLEAFFRSKMPGDIINDLKDIPADLKQKGATFVTLTKRGQLRGCIGKLKPVQPIYKDVIENTYSAAFDDFRFEPLIEKELPEINIEISILTPMEKFDYNNSNEFLKMLKVKKPGLYIISGYNSSTYLPQVWDLIPEAEKFITELCLKAGLEGDYWQKKHLEVFTYDVINFFE